MKKLKYDDPSLRPPKAMMQLVDAFTDNYSPVMREEDAGVIFTVAKLREYFNAWPAPKMPDPLPPYLNELERRGFAMQTGYDGQPSLFCVRHDTVWDPCGEGVEEDDDDGGIRTGLTGIRGLLERRLGTREEYDDEEDDENEEPYENEE